MYMKPFRYRPGSTIGFNIPFSMCTIWVPSAMDDDVRTERMMLYIQPYVTAFRSDSLMIALCSKQSEICMIIMSQTVD